MKIVVTIETIPTDYWREITVPSVVQVSDDGALRTYTLDAAMAFEKEQIDIKQLQLAYIGLLRDIAAKDVELVEVEFTQEDFRLLGEELSELDQAKRIVRLLKDLNLSGEHFKYRSANLKAWEVGVKDEDEGIVYLRKLQHPYYYKDDLRQLKGLGLKIKVKKKYLKELDRLAEEEAETARTIYFRPAPDGYYVFVHELRSELFKTLEKEAVVKYNRKAGRGKYVVEELRFIKRAYFSEAVDTEEDEGTREDDEDDEDDEKGSAEQEFKELQDDGYHAFECQMFTLASIHQFFLKQKDVLLDGVDDLYPEFPKLSFRVRNPLKHKEALQLDFQQEAFDNWRANGNLGTIALPTGSGKTFIGLMAIAKLKVPTLIVTPTIEMVYQWKDMLTKWCGIKPSRIGVYWSKEKQVREITIITFQSGHRRVHKEIATPDDIEVDESLVQDIERISQQVGFLILDEGHHAPAPIFQRIMVHMKSQSRMSLTATPYREDKNEALAFIAMGGVVITKDYASLAEEKVVAPIDYQRILLDFSEEEKQIIALKQSIKDKRRQQRKGYGGYGLEEEVEKAIGHWANHSYNVLITEMTGEEPLINSTRQIRIRNLFGFAEKKWEALSWYLDKHKDSKILVFNQWVVGAQIIQHYITEHIGLPADLMTGSTKKKVRKQIFENFKKKKSGILVTTTVLDEGINVPDCDVVIIFNGSRSKRQMIQRVGRGCRYQPGKIEYVYEFVVGPLDLISGERAKTIGEYSWRRQAADLALLLRRIKSKQETGSYGSTTHGRRDEIQQAQVELYEYEVATYRDIRDTINPEKMAEILREARGEEPIEIVDGEAKPVTAIDTIFSPPVEVEEEEPSSPKEVEVEVEEIVQEETPEEVQEVIQEPIEEPVKETVEETVEVEVKEETPE